MQCVRALLDAGADPWVDEEGKVGTPEAPANLTLTPEVQAVLKVKAAFMQTSHP